MKVGNKEVDRNKVKTTQANLNYYPPVLRLTS